MEPDIAPLAKRLAEENNVSWQHLHGSGANGRIVERDVLEYLARVMSGEEAMNPTPEPVPEGMEAWPEQDVQGFYSGQSQAAKTMVQDLSDVDGLLDVSEDLFTDKSFSPEELGFSADTPDGSRLNSDIDEGIFLFDDDLLEGDSNEISVANVFAEESEDFAEVDVLLDDRVFEVETAFAGKDNFAQEDPFGQADEGFAFGDTFGDDTGDFSLDDALTEDDAFSAADVGEIHQTKASFDDSAASLPSDFQEDKQAAQNLADELFSVDLDEDLTFDEDISSMFVDEHLDLEPNASLELAAEHTAEEVSADSLDDFAVSALDDLLPEDVLSEAEDEQAADPDSFGDTLNQHLLSDEAFEVEAVQTLEDNSDTADLFADLDDLEDDSLDMEADELFDTAEDLAAEDLLAEALETTEDSPLAFEQFQDPDSASETILAEDFAEDMFEAEAPLSAEAALDPWADTSDEIIDVKAHEADDSDIYEETDSPEILEAESEFTAFKASENTEFEDNLSFNQDPELAEEPDVSDTMLDALPLDQTSIAAEQETSFANSEPETLIVPPLPAVAPTFSQSSPFMSYGLVLRRHVNITELQTVTAIVSQELNLDSVDLGVFLLRAAAKAVGENIGFAEIIDNSIEIKQVKPSFNVALRDTLAAFARAHSIEDISELSLVIANMSDFDVDDAVLNLPVPVLTLGRARNQEATLTLSGTMAADKGASLLAEIADLLAKPVSLIV